MASLREFSKERLATAALAFTLGAGAVSYLWDQKALGGDWGSQPEWSVQLYYVLLGVICAAAAASLVTAILARKRGLIVAAAILVVLSIANCLIEIIGISFSRSPGFM